MAVWALQDAKAKFSEVVDRAISEGPQEVTRHGRDAVVVVSADTFARLAPHLPTKPEMTLGQYLLTAPQADFDFEIEHIPVVLRDIDFTDDSEAAG